MHANLWIIIFSSELKVKQLSSYNSQLTLDKMEKKWQQLEVEKEFKKIVKMSPTLLILVRLYSLTIWQV